MHMISRRRLLLGAGSAGVAPRFLAAVKDSNDGPLGLPMGCQVFVVREQLVKDFDGTLRELHGLGYRVIEFCSPPSFVTMGFAPLVNMSGTEIRQRATGAGLRVVSCHFQFHELQQHLDERIAFAEDLGVKHMIVATLAISPAAPMDDWRHAADVLNGLGERTRKAGIQLGFHNHGFEFKEIGGVMIFDELMRRLDRELVKSQFQVASVFSLGIDPVTYLTKYPGRFLSLHLQDWLTAMKKEVPMGQGSIDWTKVFTAAKTSGISYYFVEMGMEALKTSCRYLQDLKV